MLKLEKDAADLRDAVLAMYKKHIEVISELPTQQDVEELNEKLYDSKEEETAPVEQEAETASEELLTDVQPSEVEFEGEVITEASENEMEGNNEVQEEYSDLNLVYIYFIYNFTEPDCSFAVLAMN